MLTPKEQINKQSFFPVHCLQNRLPFSCNWRFENSEQIFNFLQPLHLTFLLLIERMSDRRHQKSPNQNLSSRGPKPEWKLNIVFIRFKIFKCKSGKRTSTDKQRSFTDIDKLPPKGTPFIYLTKLEKDNTINPIYGDYKNLIKSSLWFAQI